MNAVKTIPFPLVNFPGMDDNSDDERHERALGG